MYFLYPLVAWLILRSRAPRSTILLVLAWCALWIAITTALCDHALDVNAWAVARYGPIGEIREPLDDFAASDSYVRGLLYFSPYLRMSEFVLGSLIAQLYVQLGSRKPGGWENATETMVFPAAAASMILITYLMCAPDVGMDIFRKMYFALAPSAALLMFCAARYPNVFSRLLTTPSALVRGDVSYSIYLVHYVVLMIATKLIGSAVHGGIFNAIALILSTIATLVVSILLYACYKSPVRKWLRWLWRDKRPPVMAAKI